MLRTLLRIGLIAVLTTGTTHAQQLSSDPLPPIDGARDVVTVSVREFALIPDRNGRAARMMNMVQEPNTGRFFVTTLDGAVYVVSQDGQTVTPYLDVNDARWNVGVYAPSIDTGMMSFALHPQFAQAGAPGYGRFYTYTDTPAGSMPPDFVPNAPSGRLHDTVLLEWTAKNPSASAYDGGDPRVVFRMADPTLFHSGGHLGFNPLARPGDAEYGLLYVGSSDGGPNSPRPAMPQDLNSIFGKILRIDPLGSNSANKQYGIPPANPFANDGREDTLAEVYAYGLRNPQRFTWDAKDGRMYVADIGENLVEEVSPVTAGANLGWSAWEGSFRYAGTAGVDIANPRSAEGLTWPVVEFDHRDPLLPPRQAITGLVVYREGPLTLLRNKMIFGDIAGGEILYVDADNLPPGGNRTIRRILLNDGGTPRPLLQIVRAKNESRGRPTGGRADLRFGFGAEGQVFILNKHDGVIRQIEP
ncbi:MAG: PQQ-dependent sugar dehydrogenase [Acidobacteria bacterium]|nr:PQQ-dependent sugar dehydrogenase [Acidobacteriota bacterium]